MKKITEGRAFRLCLIILIISFAMIFVFNYATPMLSDDYSYGAEVREASGLLDLVRQEEQQYQSWTGRSTVHLLLRISLALPNILFKVVNSLVFLVLSILIMLNVKGPRRWSPVILTMATVALWTASVSFCQTILWQTGACNYLWGTSIILGYMTFIRFRTDRCLRSGSAGAGEESGTFSAPIFERDVKPRTLNKKDTGGVLFVIAAFLLGIPAGWGNENTSGGCLVFILLLILYVYFRTHRVPAFLAAATAGVSFGIFMMVRAPGNAIRSAAQNEEHSGLYALVSRFQKATLTIGEEFPWLLALLILTIVITAAQYRRLSARACMVRLQNRLVFAFLWLITSYALILTAEPQKRAYFGAGIFLIIAVLQGIRDNVADERAAEMAEERMRKAAGTSEGPSDDGKTGDISRSTAGVQPISGMIVRIGYSALLLFIMLRFFFVFVDAGADNLRIYRDSKERVNYINEQKNAGNTTRIVVAELHPGFENDYTEAYDSELSDDPGYWTNVEYERYFGVDEIVAIPYDEWKEQYKEN